MSILISKASALSFKISLQICSVYGCLFNCNYQLDNFFFLSRESYGLCLMEVQCKPFVTAFTVMKSNFYRIVSLKQMIP